VDLNGCEIWSRTYTGGIGKRLLRKIFGTKRDEIIGGWKKLHNEELHNLFSSPN
jgi:hypothetical protein